jgi:hypothetical protein
MGKLQEVIGFMNDVSGPNTGRRTHSRAVAMDWRTRVIAKLVIKYERACLPFDTVVTAAFESSSELKIQNKLVIIRMRCSQGERVRELWTLGSVKLMSFGKFW